MVKISKLSEWAMLDSSLSIKGKSKLMVAMLATMSLLEINAAM